MLSARSEAEDFCRRQQEKGAGGQRHAIGDAGLRVMELHQPGLAHQKDRQRLAAQQHQGESQYTAQQAGHQGGAADRGEVARLLYKVSLGMYRQEDTADRRGCANLAWLAVDELAPE